MFSGILLVGKQIDIDGQNKLTSEQMVDQLNIERMGFSDLTLLKTRSGSSFTSTLVI